MSTVFRAEEAPPKTRIDYWQHVLSDMIGPLEVRYPAGRELRERFQVGELGVVRVAEFWLDQSARGDRTTRHVRGADSDLYKIEVHGAGRAVIDQAGRQACLEPGDLTLVDLSRPCRWQFSPSRFITVVFPAPLLPFDRDDLARLTGVRLPGCHGLTALASSFARQLPRHLDDGNPTDQARLGTAVLDLLSTALASRLDRFDQVPPTTQQRALLLQIHAYIERHLSEPNLSPASIAAANAVSLRYLHKLFETEQTTVADRVRRRRLERCRRDLLDPTLQAQPVSTIAARWGFTDPAHFNRLFRTTHGTPPAQWRQTQLVEPPGDKQPRLAPGPDTL